LLQYFNEIAGWVVQYLVEVRHGELSKMGYVPSGYYGGLTIGRLLLAEPTHRFGEMRTLLVYSAFCFVMQLIFWLVPNIISSAVVFSVMGFFLGPFFAAVSCIRILGMLKLMNVHSGCISCLKTSSETSSTRRARYI
jgi:fucose permease